MESDIKECELLKTCGFFEKYEKISKVACKGLIDLYCRGPKQNECKRKEYRLATGNPPDVSMMPNGKMLK